MSTILVVDDEKDVITLIKFILEKDGHTVVEAFNGEEALKALKPPEDGKPALKPDAIVLDIMMPVMDGYTLNTRLQQSDATRSIPVVVLTAKGAMRDLFEMAPNVAAYVEKPFEPGHFKEVLQGVLSKG